MDKELDLEWQTSKDKELTRLFWNKFVFRTSLHDFFRLVTRLKQQGKITGNVGEIDVGSS